MTARVRNAVWQLTLVLAGVSGCNGLVGTDEVTVDADPDANGGTQLGSDAPAVVPTSSLNCSFIPDEPGVGKGKQFPTTLSWKGYAAGALEPGELHAAQLYDCDGSKGIHVVVYELAKFFCGSCEQDAKTLEKRLGAWQDEGLHVEWVTALVTGPDGQSAPSVEGAQVWREKFNFSRVHVVADPGYQLLPPGKSGFGTPSFVIVDPRTQEVVDWREGLGGQDALIVETAKKNAAAL